MSFRTDNLKKDVAIAKSQVGLLLLTSDVDAPFKTARISPKKAGLKFNLEETEEQIKKRNELI